MIEKVLEAYEAKVTGRKTFMQQLAMMDTITKIVLGGVVIGAVLLFIIAFLVPAQIILIITSPYVAVIYIATLLLERMRRKKWKTNLKGYNNDLDLLAEILKEKDFNLYEKNKIKQLIRKYYQDIETQESKKNKKNNDIREFICTYIVPVIAFFAGRINTDESSSAEWLAVGIVIIIVVVSGKYICYSIIELIGMISWNQLEKEKYFVLKLQDLLDREFIIEQEDLIS